MKIHHIHSLGSLLFLLLFIAGLSSCHEGSERQMKKTVDSFSTAYFNWQFNRAVPHVTPQSVKWLRYVASQVTQEDVDSLRQMPEGAACHLESLDYIDDSVAVAMVSVRHFLMMDSIGRPSHVKDEATYQLKMLYDGDMWKVNLTAVPRAEREKVE